MPALDFGQPERGIIPMAYVVADIRAAMADWTRSLGVGPWFLLDRFTGEDPIPRGAPARGAVTLAMAFAGHMQIELLQPLDDHDSVYRETIDAPGYGFHHWGAGSRDLEADVARHEALGHDVAFRAGAPTGGSVVYMDTNGALPEIVELIELGGPMEETFTRFYAASLTWDGAEPVRPFG